MFSNISAGVDLDLEVAGQVACTSLKGLPVSPAQDQLLHVRIIILITQKN